MRQFMLIILGSWVGFGIAAWRMHPLASDLATCRLRQSALLYEVGNTLNGIRVPVGDLYQPAIDSSKYIHKHSSDSR